MAGWLEMQPGPASWARATVGKSGAVNVLVSAALRARRVDVCISPTCRCVGYSVRPGAEPLPRPGTLTATSFEQPASLEVQALEVIPVDRDLVGCTFPVGDVQRPKSSAKARVQLVFHGGGGWGAGRNVDLRTLNEG